MKNYSLIALFLFAVLPFGNAQFVPSQQGLIIIVTDGTDRGKNSEVQPADTTVRFTAPINPLGMKDAIQAAAFIDRPQYGLYGFLLIFCVNDSIGGEQGRLFVNGKMYKGIYRLIRQKNTPDEEIPENMLPYRLSGTIFLLGIS